MRLHCEIPEGERNGLFILLRGTSYPRHPYNRGEVVITSEKTLQYITGLRVNLVYVPIYNTYINTDG